MKRFGAVCMVAAIVGALALANGCGGGGTKPLEGAKPVVILGVDGMDPGLLQEFVRKGVMPNFEQFMQEGSFSPLGTSTPPQSPISAASAMNWRMMAPRVAPMALRTPISRVRSEIDIVMVLMIESVPTTSAMSATV